LRLNRKSTVAHYLLSTPAYIVLRDMQHHVIEVHRLEPATDLSGAMAAAIRRLKEEGWLIEGSAIHGLVFVQRAGERRLLLLTMRDPYSTARQSFDPFHGK
jgi:hypothetical protein